MHRTNWTANENEFGQFMDGYLSIINAVTVSICAPLNIWVMYNIIRRKQFRLHRNVAWLGIGVSNILLVLYHPIEDMALQYRMETARSILPYVSGVPLVSLLTYLVLSVMDRYVCVFHSNFYRHHVTLGRIVSIQLIAFPLIYLGVKYRLLFESTVPVYYEEMVNQQLIGSIYSTFFIACLITYPLLSSCCHPVEKDDRSRTQFSVVHYYESLLSKNAPEDAIPPNDVELAEFLRENGDAGRIISFALKDDADDDEPSPFVRVKGQRVCRFDLDALHHLLWGMLIFLVACTPECACFFTLNRCLQMASVIDECHWQGRVYYYSRAAYFVFYSFCQPLHFALCRRDKIFSPTPQIKRIEKASTVSTPCAGF